MYYEVWTQSTENMSKVIKRFNVLSNQRWPSAYLYLSHKEGLSLDVLWTLKSLISPFVLVLMLHLNFSSWQFLWDTSMWFAIWANEQLSVYYISCSLFSTGSFFLLSKRVIVTLFCPQHCCCSSFAQKIFGLISWPFLTLIINKNEITLQGNFPAAVEVN